MDCNSGRTSVEIQVEIEERLGFIPIFFTPAFNNPQVLENLWQQTKTAYIDNPLPTLFKEKLSAYLSRFCTVPYCMICHSCSLRALGVKAKDVLELLESPPLQEEEIDKSLRVLSQSKALSQSENEEVYEKLLPCAVFIALEGESVQYYRIQLKNFLGSVNYQHLVSLISYVKTCHSWMEFHPEVAYQYKADQRAIDHLNSLQKEEPNLRDFFDNYLDKVKRERLIWVDKLVEKVKNKQQQEMLHLFNTELEQQVWQRTRDLQQANQQLKLEISQRRLAEQKLQSTNNKLLSANAELEQFAEIIAHDLREPLRKISCYTEMLIESYPKQLDTEIDRYSQYIKDGVLRLHTQITDLLTYSQLLKGKLVTEATELTKVVEEVLGLLSEKITENNALIIWDDLPLVQANRKQIRQLFTQLIDNALKFRSPNQPKIEIKAQSQDKQWLISVSDNGIGLKPRYNQKIFEIFRRLHTREKYFGNGMGLTICKKIIERHGGKIWVKSELGEGTTFYFTLNSV